MRRILALDRCQMDRLGGPSGSAPTKLTALLVVAGSVAVTVPAHAERPDCGLFPDMHPGFACYDKVSRAPIRRPDESFKPDAAKAVSTKAATSRSLNIRAN